MKRRRLFLAAVVLAALAAPSAEASWVPLPPPDSYVVHPVSCPYFDEPGVACAVDRRVTYWQEGQSARTVTGQFELWVPRYGSRVFEREVLLHELGHVFDVLSLDDAERQTFAAIHSYEVGWRERVGRSGGGAYPGTVEELFAEAYALCGLHGFERRRLGYRVRRGRWTPGVYGYSPTRAEFRATCKLIRGAA